MTAAVVDLEVARVRIEARRARRVVNRLRLTHGIAWPTEAVGLLAHLPAHHLTDDERWFLGQVPPDRRARCAAVWTEGEGGVRISGPTPRASETRPLSRWLGDCQVQF